MSGHTEDDVDTSKRRFKGKYTTGQTWAALKKAWKGYKIAKVHNDTTRMVEYARKIRTLQDELGIKQSSFPDLGKFGLEKRD